MVSCAPGSIPVNDASTCTVTVTDTDIGPQSAPGGTIALASSGTGTFTACTLTASNPATCTSTFTPSVIGTGRHSLTATYAATDSIHAGSNTSTAFALTVRTRTTTTGVSCAPSSIPVNDSSTCTVTVTDTDSGTKSAPGGTITPASSGTGTFTACTLSASNPATCTSTYTPSVIGTGTHNITATYAATDSIHAGSNNTGTAFALTVRAPTTLTLNSVSPTSVSYGSHGRVTFTATLKRNDTNGAVAGATISFSVDGTAVGTATTNGSGVATFSTYDPSGLTAGAHNVRASFAGQTLFGITYHPGASGTPTLTGNPFATLSVSPISQQYSDPVTFTVTITPARLGNGTLSATSITVSVGTQNMGTLTYSSSLTESGGVLAGTLSNVALLEPVPFGTAPTGQMAPGSHTVTAVAGGVAPSVTIANATTTLTITQEDARVTYAGNMFVGIPLTSTTGTITLIATIQDITAVTGDPAYDQYPGDIRNATVTFVDRGNGNAPLCTAPVLLVNSSDTKTGSVTCTFSGTVGSTGSTQYTVGIVVGGYYTRNASTDNTVVTISQVGAGMITGGGYLVMQNSAGTIAGDLGTKDNFGFNVKYTKNGNLQGNINTIVRRKESDGIQHVYQIKGNSMTALAVSQLVNATWVSGCTGATSTSPCKAQFNSKASIQDITNLLVPLSVPGSGNSSLQFNMTDYGSPGSSDTIGITLWNGTGGIWFSTNWVGSPPATVEQLIGGGNLDVH